jgi:hypothetical protein
MPMQNAYHQMLDESAELKLKLAEENAIPKGMRGIFQSIVEICPTYTMT